MTTSRADPRLAQLERDLRVIHEGKVARQEDMAAALKIDQGTISKAKKGHLKRWTATTEALQQHANMLIGKTALSDSVQRSIRTFLAAGGREDDLCAILQTATDLVTGRRR